MERQGWYDTLKTDVLEECLVFSPAPSADPHPMYHENHPGHDLPQKEFFSIYFFKEKPNFVILISQ
jgi:hypothetical protein